MSFHNNGRPATAGTLFRIGSTTKTFNTLAVLLLVKQDGYLYSHAEFENYRRVG